MTTLPTVGQLAYSMQVDIATWVQDGTIPATIESFDDLNSYVDANCIGGCELLFGEIVTPSESDSEHQAKLDAFMSIRDPAIEIVDAWIKSGALRA